MDTDYDQPRTRKPLRRLGDTTTASEPDLDEDDEEGEFSAEEDCRNTETQNKNSVAVNINKKTKIKKKNTDKNEAIVRGQVAQLLLKTNLNAKLNTVPAKPSVNSQVIRKIVLKKNVKVPLKKTPHDVLDISPELSGEKHTNDIDMEEKGMHFKIFMNLLEIIVPLFANFFEFYFFRYK